MYVLEWPIFVCLETNERTHLVLRRRLQEDIWRPCKIVAGHGQQHVEVHPLLAAELGLKKWPYGFALTKDVFDTFVKPLTDVVALMAGGPTIDRQTPVRVVLGHVRDGLQFSQLGHKVSGIVRLVREKPQAMSDSNNPSRFLVNVEWSHTGSSSDEPTNQRNNRLCSPTTSTAADRCELSTESAAARPEAGIPRRSTGGLRRHRSPQNPTSAWRGPCSLSP